MENYNALSIIEQNDLATVSQSLKKIAAFQAIVQQTLKKDHDFGIIPGTPKPTLYKPGAEKICMLMQVNPEYEYIDRTVDFEKGFFNYELRCTLVKNVVVDGVLIKMPVSQGVGSCNNMEKKYRWMSVKEQDMPADMDKSMLKKSTDKWGKVRYQVENDDPYTLANTVLKMAKKRAMIDASLQLASLSEVFTQDVEDIKDFMSAEPETVVTHSANSAPVSASNDLGDFTLSFGKHSGKTLNELASTPEGLNYLQWACSEKSTLNADTKSRFALFLKSQGKPTQSPPKPKPEVVKAKEVFDASNPFPNDADCPLPFDLN